MYFSIISPYSCLGQSKALSTAKKGPWTRSSLTKMLLSLCINNVYSYLELQIKHQFLKDVTTHMTRSDMRFFFRVLTSFFNCALAYVNMYLMTGPDSGLSFPQKHGLYQSDCWLQATETNSG